MIKRASAEEWIAQLEEVIRRYRRPAGDGGARNGLSQEQAVELLRKLGLTRGEALRLLRHSH